MITLMHPLLALALAGASPPDADKIQEAPLPSLDGASTTRTRLAVMSLAANGVPEEYAAGLTESLATQAQQTGVFETISPRQISSLLAYEKRKELLGGCVQEACYVQVAKVVRADHLIAGSVAKVGDKLSLNLVLIDPAEGKALKRTEKIAQSASELLSAAAQASVVLLQPVLSARRGYLKVAANVEGAGVVVDDERRTEGVGQVIPLAAGPHVLKVTKDGFYSAVADVFVSPSRVSEETVKLIPAKETIEGYETRASLMRYGAYASGAVAVGATIAAAFFYTQATDDKELVDRYANALDAQRASGAVGTFQEAKDAESSFGTNQSLYLVGLGTALLTGALSTYLFVAGDDPDRYEEFRSLNP